MPVARLVPGEKRPITEHSHSVHRIVRLVSLIDVLSMGHTNYKNQQNIIFDLINNAIITYPNSICPVCTGELFDSVRSWINSQKFDLALDRGNLGFIDSPEILLC